MAYKIQLGLFLLIFSPHVIPNHSLHLSLDLVTLSFFLFLEYAKFIPPVLSVENIGLMTTYFLLISVQCCFQSQFNLSSEMFLTPRLTYYCSLTLQLIPVFYFLHSI